VNHRRVIVLQGALAAVALIVIGAVMYSMQGLCAFTVGFLTLRFWALTRPSAA
jgi:type IV secretory pathway TrbD component